MRRSIKSAALLGVVSVIAAAASGAAEPAGKSPGPCEQITQACESAGFIKGDAKEGNGLYRDCIDPIMQGKAQPANAKIALPKIGADTVAACKQKHPEYGEGKKAQQAPPQTKPAN